VGFRGCVSLPREPCRIRLTACSLYRLWVNGRFVGHGPARGPHGYARVDEWELTPFLTRPRNLVAVEVAGYNANSYYLLDEPAFLQAEVVAGTRVLAATGRTRGGFQAQWLPERLQKVGRFSFQRLFSEVYQLTPLSRRWRQDPAYRVPARRCALQEPRRLLPRGVAYPAFSCLRPVRVVARGTVETGVAPEKVWRERSQQGIGPLLKGFAEKELERDYSLELQHTRTTLAAIALPLGREEALHLEARQAALVSFGRNLTGFIGARVTCRQPARLVLLFDELLSPAGDVEYQRLGCLSLVAYELEAGE
jgi:alpha-L-rhamnosidase